MICPVYNYCHTCNYVNYNRHYLIIRLLQNRFIVTEIGRRFIAETFVLNVPDVAEKNSIGKQQQNRTTEKPIT